MKKSKGVKGEASYDSSSQKVSRFESTPLAPKIYEGKLLPGSELAKATGKGKLPYVRSKFEVLNTASKKGGKNRVVFHNFFLNTSPDADGKASINRGGGLTEYTQAIKARLKAPYIKMKKINPKTGEESTVRVLDPDIAVRFLEKSAGRVLKLKTKNEPDQNDPDKKWPKIDFFVPSGEESEEDEEETDEDDETEEETEDSDEDEDESEEDDEESDESDDDEDDEDEEDDEDSEDEDEEDSDDEDEDEDEDSEDDEDEEPVKTKKRGRPPGSKNKKSKK